MIQAESPKRTHQAHRRRGGVAAVEMAVCLPLLVLFTFASIEMCFCDLLEAGS